MLQVPRLQTQLPQNGRMQWTIAIGTDDRADSEKREIRDAALYAGEDIVVDSIRKRRRAV